LSAGKFALLRAIRLYPLVELGVFLSVGRSIALQMLDRGDPQSFGVVQIAFAMLLLPYITAASADMYLVLSPTWSLFNELTINIVYAAIARFLNNRALVLCCVLSGITLFTATVVHGSVLFGPFRGTLLMGLVRTSFSFSIGMLIYRLRYETSTHVGLFAFVGILVVSASIFCVPELGRLNGVYDAVVVIAVIPAIIAIMAHVKLSGRSIKIATLLGDLSYAVYILHWPIRGAIFATGIQTKISQTAFLSLSSAFICLCAVVALKLYDQPVRSYLMKKAFGKESAAAAHPVTAP
jgi:peptidoglycan/LPS O-acetylase OafA/YrhL